jgi:alpha-galactosidase
MLENPQVIAIDQDPLGIQGSPIRTADNGQGQVWVKPLRGGDRAVALLNRGGTAIRLTTSLRAIGIARAGGHRIENMWTHRSSTTVGTISARVAPRSALLYRVTAR